eukprot:m.23838 g.23838  ORF g.23838 m.23838 type:complete len:468 (-) comp7545_c0_seq1:41-1444(-)
MAGSEEKAKLLGSNLQNEFTLYPVRWWILLQVSFVSFNQSLFWITFSPIYGPSKEYFGVSTSIVTWWLNIGVVAAMLFFPISVKLMERQGSIKTVIVLSGVLQAIGMCARLLTMIHPTSTWATVVIFFAQILIGVVGPLVMSIPPLVSAQWFGEHERPFATAISTLANSTGSAFGFIMSSYLAAKADQMPTLLYTHAGIAVANLVMILMYFPAAPRTPPSAVALEYAQGKRGSSSSSSTQSKDETLFAVLQNPSFMILGLSGGMLAGVFNAWSGSFDDILHPLNPKRFTQTLNSWLGFGCTIAAIAGGTILGRLTDIDFFFRNMKGSLTLMATITSIIMTYFTLALPSTISSKPLLPSTFYVTCALIVTSAFFLGGVFPIMYELAAELTYPAPESTAANVIVLIINIAAFIFLFTLDTLNKLKALNLVMTGTAVLGIVLFLAVKPVYRRRAAEHKNQLARESIQAVA